MFPGINYITKRPRVTVKRVAATRTGKAAALYRAAAAAFTQQLVDELGDKVRAVVLYGPAVLGIKPGDRDGALFVVSADDASEVREQSSGFAHDIMEENNYAFYLRPTVYPVSQVTVDLQRRSQHILEMLEEGIVLYDTGLFEEQGREIRPARR